MSENLDAQYELLIRAVAQGIREVYAAGAWNDVAPRAEALWMLYAMSTGLAWSDVEARVRRAWEIAAGEQ